jgi:SPP1 gp7 family putative phage head morphogenesis protein
MDKLDPLFIALILSIKIDSEKQADDGMKDVYKTQRDERDELLKYIAIIYTTLATDGVLKPSYRQFGAYQKEFKAKLQDMAKRMGSTEVESITNLLKDGYKTGYYQNGYVLSLGSKAQVKKLSIKQIEKAVNTKIDGKLFSDRIWKNKSDMINKLNLELNEALNGKRTIDQIARNIRKEFNVQAYESQRLARTEMARAQTQASTDFARDAGIKRQMFDATLDNKTTHVCRGYDGSFWDIDDPAKPTPPLLPNCRSCLVNVPNDRWKPTKKWDNQSKETIDYKDYDSWLKENNLS